MWITMTAIAWLLDIQRPIQALVITNIVRLSNIFIMIVSDESSPRNTSNALK